MRDPAAEQAAAHAMLHSRCPEHAWRSREHARRRMLGAACSAQRARRSAAQHASSAGGHAVLDRLCQVVALGACTRQFRQFMADQASTADQENKDVNDAPLGCECRQREVQQRSRRLPGTQMSSCTMQKFGQIRCASSVPSTCSQLDVQKAALHSTQHSAAQHTQHIGTA